ncbi:MAG: DPP IV N-terminal domain-containing protein [Vicingaceae bacterium]
MKFDCMRILGGLTLLLFLNISGQAGAQDKKTLSLEDAVTKQYSDFSPRNLRGLVWLDRDTYSYIKGKGEEEALVSFDIKKDKERIEWTIQSLKKAIGEKAKDQTSLPAFSKIGENLLTFELNGVFFLWNAGKGTVNSYENEFDAISDVHFSPSGASMAYVKDHNLFVKSIGKERIQLTQDGNENIVYGKAVSRFEFGITEGIFWSPYKDEAIAYYRNDQSQVTDYPLVDLTLLPAKMKAIKYPMAGGESESITVMVQYLESGRSVQLKTEPAVHAYLPSVNWTPDGKHIKLVTLNRGQDYMQYIDFDPKTGDMGAVFYKEKDEKYVEPLYPLVFLDEAGSRMVHFSQKEGFMVPYLITDDKEVKLMQGDFPITRYIGMNSANSVLFVESTGEDATENHIYRINLETSKSERISKNHGFYRSKLSDDGNYFITEFSNIDVPRKIVIADNKGIVLKQLLIAADPLEGYAVSRPEIFNITNRTGTVLHARMVKPQDFDSTKKYPVLVYVYNGPHVQLIRNSWWAGASLWMNYLAEQGYIVFTLDGRGSYNRGKEFEQVIYRNVGKYEMEDQVDGVRYLKGLNYVDTAKLSVHGWSYGGYMTASLMLKYPGLFNAGVAGGPVTNWAYYEIMYTERYMDDPKTNPEGFKETDLRNYVSSLEGKLMLIHGLNDDVVVPQHNFNLVKKFVDEGIQVDFFPYPGHSHNVRGKDRVHLMRKVVDYIIENNHP